MKRTKKLKIFMLVLFVLYMCFYSYAAIVSDNDGSAFVTKAEFDALRTNFNKQIDDYNKSIDGKIDGSIAQYLAGLSISSVPINYWESINSIAGNDFWFVNNFDTDYVNATMAGVSSFKYGLNINVKRELYYHYWSNPFWGPRALSRLGHGYVFVALGNTSTISWDGTQGHSWIFQGQVASNNTSGDEWYDGSSLTINKTTNGINVLNTNTFDYDTYSTNIIKTENGNGAAFVYHKAPSGYMYLRECCSSIYPLININGYGHTYSDFGKNTVNDIWNTYCVNTGRDSNVSLSTTLPEFTAAGVESKGGTELPSDSTSDGAWSSGYIAVVRTSDNIDYSRIQWGKMPTNSFIVIKDTFDLVSDSTTKEIQAVDSESTRRTLYYNNVGANGYDSKVSGVKVTYTPSNLVYETSHQLKDFSQEIVTAVAGEQVHIGGGVPLLENPGEERNINIKIKFKSASGSSVPIKFSLSNKQFSSGNVPSDTTKYTNPTGDGYESGTTGTEYSYSINIPSKGKIWLNVYNSSTGEWITIDYLRAS